MGCLISSFLVKRQREANQRTELNQKEEQTDPKGHKRTTRSATGRNSVEHAHQMLQDNSRIQFFRTRQREALVASLCEPSARTLAGTRRKKTRSVTFCEEGGIVNRAACRQIRIRTVDATRFEREPSQKAIVTLALRSAFECRRATLTTYGLPFHVFNNSFFCVFNVCQVDFKRDSTLS